MSNFFDQFDKPGKAPEPAGNQFDAFDKAPVYSGSILPLSKYRDGSVAFDSNAGVLGAVKRAFMLPGQVMKGEVQIRGDDGRITDEAIERAGEMATVAGPVNPAIRAGQRAIPGVAGATRREAVPVPTAEELRAASQAGYNQVRDMGVDFSSTAITDLAGKTRMALEQDGILESLAPKTFRILSELQNAPAGSVAPLSGVEAARRAFGNAAKDFTNPTEQLAANRVIEALGKFTTKPDPATVVAGPAAAAGKLQADARANYAAAKRSERLAGVEERAELRSSGANSGQNLDNTLRQRAADILIRPKEAAGFSNEELAALEQVVRGGFKRNALRGVGNLLGGGGGMGAVVSGAVGGLVGGAFGGPALGAAAGAGVPAAGLAAKAAAGRATSKAFKAVDEMTRMRSPLYEQLVKEAGTMAISPERRALLLRAAFALRQNPDAEAALLMEGATE